MKVMIVDDEQAMHLIMKRMLGKIPGIEIIGAFYDTASAYHFLTDHEVDLIFIDIHMPKESGIEFAQRLRDGGKQTKLVFVTSHKEYALHAFDVYAYDYMVKPVVQDRLRHTVNRLLSERASSSTLAKQQPGEEKPWFYCLGRMEVRNALNEIIKWKTSKSSELFAYLLLHKGRLVSRARIIEDIFGGMPLKNAESYLNTTAYQLRKLLEACGLKGGLHSDSHHYALNLNDTFIDVFLFEEGIKQLPVIHDSNLAEAMGLEQLYVGDLFGDLAYAWAWSDIERFSQMYIAFSQRLSVLLLERGDTVSALRLLAKQSAMNELDEETTKLFMQALALQKNREALIHKYEHFADSLFSELGVGPSHEVTALYHKLLSELDA